MVKLPLPPEPAALAAKGLITTTINRTTVLWRVHFTASAHPTAWDALRRYGPVANCRFDPHEPPPHLQREGVAYLAGDVPTALAEVFQTTRVINARRGAPHLSGFRSLRDLRLFDLTGDWPVRIGASHTINTGSKARTRAWARALRAAWPDTDGIWHTSAMTGRPCVTLFNPAENAFPEEPDFSEPLGSPSMIDYLASSADSIGYTLL